jgi:hypothetical protein
MSSGRLTQVLLVGDASARFEVDLVPYGLACVNAGSANDAVAVLKGTPFPFVVVAAALPDMTGPAFVDGLLRHFEPNAVILLGEVDPAQAAQLQRTQKVAIFPAATDGAVIADVLFKRASSTPPSTVPPAPSAQQSSPGFPAFPGPGTTRGLFGEQRAPTGSAPALGTPPSTWAPPAPSSPPRAASTGQAFFAAMAQNGAGGIAQSLPPQLTAQLPPQLAQQSMAPSMAQALSTLPPVAAPSVDRATLERLEQMATELANANAEVITLRARLSAAEASSTSSAERLVAAEARAARAEAELAQARTEIDAARRSAISQVAEVMALSDDGEPISEELDDLQSKVDMAESERDSAASQLAMVRMERDRLTAELTAAREELQRKSAELDAAQRQVQMLQAALEEAHAAAAMAEHKRTQIEAQHKADVEAAVADKAAAVDAVRAEAAAAVEAVRAEAAAAHAADVDAHVEARAGAAEAALAAMRDELLALQREKADVEAAWAADQKRAEEFEAKLGEAEAAKLDVETKLSEFDAGLRADLNEALRRMNEAREHAALEEARADRAVDAAKAAREDAERAARGHADLQRQLEAALEADGAVEQAKANKAIAETKSVRALLESMTHEQSRLVGEIETLRPLAAEVDKARATVVDMQRQLEAALGTDDADGDTTKAIAEAVRAQTRELKELGRAIEPFSWGLERAIGFFNDKAVDGGAEHVRQLQLLQSILTRMKSGLDKIEDAPESTSN